MLRNYFKTAWRNLVRHKFYSSLNIFGLAIAIAFAFLISGYIWEELQVNKSLKNVSQQYLVESTWRDQQTNAGTKSPAAVARLLKDLYPDLVENYYRWDWVSTIITVGDKHFRDSLQIGDTTLIKMFGFPVLHGNVNTAFDNPDAIVITAAKAIKYFGRTDVTGRLLTVENYSGQHKDFVITAVLKDLPYNTVTVSTVPANASINSTFLPFKDIQFFYPGGADTDDWQYVNMTSFIQLKRGVKQKDMLQPIQQLLSRHTPSGIKANLKLDIVPLADYHLDANNGVNRKMVYTLSWIVLFILVMAIVNFINISISSSSSRLKEIGVRKVMGSMRRNIVWQLLIESFLIVFIAVAIALFLYQLMKPVAGEMLGRALPSFISLPLYFALIPVAFVFITGFLAGIYPALVLSAIKSVESLKGKLKSVKDNIFLRRTLIGLQFSIAIIVFVAAIVVTKQVSYFLNNDLGFNKELVVNVPLPRNWTEEGVRHVKTVRDEMSKLQGIADASLCYSIPNRNVINYSDLYRQGEDSTKAITAFTFITDEHFASVYQIPVLAGKFFSKEQMNDSDWYVVINETCAKALGWKSPTDAVGQKLKQGGELCTVAAVVKDYHFESKREPIKPLQFIHVENSNNYRFISFKIKPGSFNTAMAGIQNKFNQLLPGAPFEYTFLDETLHNAYKSEIRLEKAAYTATGLSLVIVLLGVIGLISINVAKRTKEIGIRKILGASVNSIVSLFAKEIMFILVVANIIAWPLAYLLMKAWLSDYAYRIGIGVYPFLIVGLILAVVTSVLIYGQTVRAALANPVKSLRTE